MAKDKKPNFWYTVIIDPDGDPEFEDFTDEKEALNRLKELREQGVPATIGWTN